MKTFLCSLFVLATFNYSMGAGPKLGKIDREKTILKTYQVNADARIDITNKFGKVHVTSWDQNKVSNEVVITVGAKNEAVALDRLKAINVEFKSAASYVEAKTVFKGVPISISYIPGVLKKLSKDTNFVPVDCFVPSEAYLSPPFSKIQ